MNIIQAIILGIVQGLTEFIPISSSAHLIIIPWLFGWNDSVVTSLPFDVALHLGTLVAVLAFFWRDWVRLIRAAVLSLVQRRIGADPDRRMAWFIILGSIPGAIAGWLGESKIEELFHQPHAPVEPRAMIVMAVIVALLGLALFLAERLARHLRSLGQINLRDALIIGIAQALAIFPGVSRSGATITAGLGLGLERPAAAKFSFLLGAPIIAGAGLKSVYEIAKGASSGAITSSELVLFPIGFVAAAVTGYLCIKVLLGFLHRHTTNIFVYYRWALAALIVAVAVARM